MTPYLLVMEFCPLVSVALPGPDPTHRAQAALPEDGLYRVPLATWAGQNAASLGRLREPSGGGPLPSSLGSLLPFHLRADLQFCAPPPPRMQECRGGEAGHSAASQHCSLLQGDLKGYLQSCRASESMAPDALTLQRMACEVACGLLHLHRHNYVHR